MVIGLVEVPRDGSVSFLLRTGPALKIGHFIIESMTVRSWKSARSEMECAQSCETTSGRPMNSGFSVLVAKIYFSGSSVVTTEKTGGFSVGH